MQTLTQLLTEFKDITKDTTTANVTRAKRRMNESQRRICARRAYWWLEKEYTKTSVADQQVYSVPVSAAKIISVRYNSGGRDYVLSEIVAPEKFDVLNQEGTDITSDYPVHWHQRDNSIYIWPTPSSSSDSFYVLARRRIVDMTLEDYTTGTIAVTNADQTVTGTTTAWVTAGVHAGSMIFINDVPYEVASVTSETALELVKPYEGSNASGLTYKVGDVPSIPEQFHDVVWMDAALTYDLKRKDIRLRDIKVLRDELLVELDNYGASRGVRNVMKLRRGRIHTLNDYPQDIG